DSQPAVTRSSSGGLALSGLSARLPTGQWQPVSGAATSANGWKAGAEDVSGCQGTTGQVSAQAAPGGQLNWSFDWTSACSPALVHSDAPAPLPALVATGLAG